MSVRFCVPSYRLDDDVFPLPRRVSAASRGEERDNIAVNQMDGETEAVRCVYVCKRKETLRGRLSKNSLLLGENAHLLWIASELIRQNFRSS